MNWQVCYPLPTLACLLLTGGVPAASQESNLRTYSVKPSEVVLPKDVPLGKYRRSIQPFENWTLICDENLAAQKKICNVSQVIEDQSGQMVFSWSLAANAAGKPYMILRIPASAKGNETVSVKFPERENAINISLDGCNDIVCVGMLPVGPVVREQIKKQAVPSILYHSTTGETITVTASLKGLTTALSAIK